MLSKKKNSLNGLWYTPSAAPEYINFLKPMLFMARYSSSGFRQGYHTFFLRSPEIQPRECEKKNMGTIWTLVSSKCKMGSFVILFVQIFVHFGDYRWECIFREISIKLPGMPTHLEWSSLTVSFCWPLSTQDCQLILTGPFCCPFSTATLRLPSPTQPLWVPLPTALASLGPAFPPHFRSHWRSRV